MSDVVAPHSSCSMNRPPFIVSVVHGVVRGTGDELVVLIVTQSPAETMISMVKPITACATAGVFSFGDSSSIQERVPGMLRLLKPYVSMPDYTSGLRSVLK